jgi:hypothetical protein
VDVKRAPAAVARQIAGLPGVADVETTVVFDVTLDLADVAEPVIGRMIGLDAAGEPQLNRLFLRQGRLLAAGRRHEALVSEGFAKARQLTPGDRLAAVLNGKREVLELVGVVLSPEYIFASRGGAIPDEKSFGVFWMDRQYLATAFDMEGAFNHAVLRLAPNASEPSVIDALDRLLDVYGCLGAYGRDEQMSHRILSQEIAQQKTMATVFPAIFLGVAVFLLHMVLSRQVATQREQIAALKALGYANATIALHYLKLVGVIVMLGIALGLMLGAWLGSAMTALYAEFFHFPHFAYRLRLWIPLTAAGVSLLAALTGVLSTVRRVARLAPAEAMRPPAPPHYRRLLLERLGLEHWLSAQARMIMRTLERRPLRAAFTSLGIACAVAILVSGTFWGDAVEYLIAVQFHALDRAHVTLTFTKPVNDRARAAQHDAAVARAALWQLQGEVAGSQETRKQWHVVSPIQGHVLRVLQESAGVVAAGTPLLELADAADLEVVVDVLTTDAVQMHPGTPVHLEGWGLDQPLAGRVRVIEPGAFTKVSALGVKEQRVNVIIDIVSPFTQWHTLGDNYRIEARILVYSRDHALKVLTSALFREHHQWMVFIVNDGRAQKRVVQVGRRNAVEAVVETGVTEDDHVIVYPSDAIRDGIRVKGQ